MSRGHDLGGRTFVNMRRTRDCESDTTSPVAGTIMVTKPRDGVRLIQRTRKSESARRRRQRWSACVRVRRKSRRPPARPKFSFLAGPRIPLQFQIVPSPRSNDQFPALVCLLVPRQLVLPRCFLKQPRRRMRAASRWRSFGQHRASRHLRRRVNDDDGNVIVSCSQDHSNRRGGAKLLRPPALRFSSIAYNSRSASPNSAIYPSQISDSLIGRSRFFPINSDNRLFAK